MTVGLTDGLPENMQTTGADEMRYFGEKFDAPLTDDAVQVDTPTDMVCMGCYEHFVEGDQGIIYPTGFAQHKECGLRIATGGIGHLIDHAFFCRSDMGPDAGMTRRQSSKLVWRHFVEHEHFTRNMLLEIAMTDARK